MASERLVVSLSTNHLPFAAQLETGIELKLNWQDYELLSGERKLREVLSNSGVSLEQIKSIHLPPGLRTRGKDIGMAATQENVGSINDFIQGQLQDISNAHLVMHTPRKFDFDDHLSLLATLCNLTNRDISIENPPGTSYWRTPEDIAFFGYVGATADNWADLYLTIDSAHLPHPRRRPEEIKKEAVETLFARIDQSVETDTHTIREEYMDYLDENITTLTPSEPEQFATDDWMPLLNTLVLAGNRVKSIHFNDPDNDGTPDLTHQREQSSLQAIREIIQSEHIYVVLEPDEEEFEQPHRLQQQVDEIANWL